MIKKDKELIAELQKKIDSYQGPAVLRPDLIEAATTINIIRMQDEIEDCKLEIEHLKQENERLKKENQRLKNNQ